MPWHALRVSLGSRSADFNGQRLDRFLASVLEGHSRSQVQKLITDGHVTLDRRDAEANLTMREGERVSIDLPEVEPATAAAEALPLEILYQDADLAVLNKPASRGPGSPGSTGRSSASP